MSGHWIFWRCLLAAACIAMASPPGRGEQFATIRPTGFEGAPAAVPAILTLPPAALRDAWGARGAPVVVVVPDHLGLDERATFHTTALSAAGIAVLRLDLPPAGAKPVLGEAVPRESRANPADDLLPALFGVLRGLDAERPSSRRPVGLLGFGAGGQAAVIAAHEAVARAFLPGPDAPRFRAHAALYPTCYGSRLRRLRHADAPTTGAPVLVVLAHEGEPWDDPSGCGVLFDRTSADERDPFTIRAYAWMRYGFDLWPAVAAIEAEQGRPFPSGLEPPPLDTATAGLARRDVASLFLPALLAPAQHPMVSRR